jgi:D-sedoheptulose 7-phosphate isomerase
MEYLDEMIERYPTLSVVREQMVRATEIMCDSYKADGKVMVCGNGGSASDSEHIVGELMKGFVLRRELPEADVKRIKDAGYEDWESLSQNLQRGIQGIALTGHPSLSTAVLNDNDPFMVFAQQVYVYGRTNDVLIGLSTSGNARNVCNALKIARAFGVTTIGMTGSRPSKMDDLCDVMIKVPETQTFKVQELHLPVYHVLCLMVEEEIFGG